MRTDANGNKLWDKRYGGSKDESVYRMFLTENGGFLLSNAGGFKTQDNYVNGVSDLALQNTFNFAFLRQSEWTRCTGGGGGNKAPIDFKIALPWSPLE